MFHKFLQLKILILIILLTSAHYTFQSLLILNFLSLYFPLVNLIQQLFTFVANYILSSFQSIFQQPRHILLLTFVFINFIHFLYLRQRFNLCSINGRCVHIIQRFIFNFISFSILINFFEYLKVWFVNVATSVLDYRLIVLVDLIIVKTRFLIILYLLILMIRINNFLFLDYLLYFVFKIFWNILLYMYLFFYLKICILICTILLYFIWTLIIDFIFKIFIKRFNCLVLWRQNLFKKIFIVIYERILFIV